MMLALRLLVAVAGAVVCMARPVTGQAVPIDSRSSPVMIATVVQERTLRPVITIAGGKFHWGWPEDVEDLGKVFPMALASIPKDWISPLSSLPGNWMVFVDDDKKISAKAVEVITLSGDNPVEATIRLSAGAEWDGLRSAVAVSGAPGADVNFVENIEPESTEGRRLTTIARRLVVDDILSEVRTGLARVDEPLRNGVFQPPREAVRLTEPIEVTIRRPRRALADGIRPVLVDYRVKYSKSGAPNSCDTQAHVRSWFNENPAGLIRALSSSIDVSFGCEWMGVDSFPDAVVQVAGYELWIGRDNYEDGTTYEAWFFRNGKLENVNLPTMLGGGAVSGVPHLHPRAAPSFSRTPRYCGLVTGDGALARVLCATTMSRAGSTVMN
jgi:hypothetical protein